MLRYVSFLYPRDNVECALLISFAADILAFGKTIFLGFGKTVWTKYILTPTFTVGNRSQEVGVLSCALGVVGFLSCLSWW